MIEPGSRSCLLAVIRDMLLRTIVHHFLCDITFGCLTYQLLSVYSARWQHFHCAEEGRVEVLAAHDSRLLLPVPVLAERDGEDDNDDNDDSQANKQDDEESSVIIIVVCRRINDNCERTQYDTYLSH